MAGDTIIIGNWNDTTPSAPAGADNVRFQKDASSPPNISAYVPRADTAGTKYGTILYDGSGNADRYLGADGAWHDMPAGSLPINGTTGQVLTVQSESPFSAGWATPAAGGGGLVLLAESVLAEAASVVTFDAISQSYKDLLVVGMYRSSASEFLRMRVNSDTTVANYVTRTWNMYGNALSANQYPVVAKSGTSGAPTGMFSQFEMKLSAYYNNDKLKTGLGRSSNAIDYALNFCLDEIYAIWKSTSPITKLEFLVSSGNVAAGTEIRLYAMG